MATDNGDGAIDPLFDELPEPGFLFDAADGRILRVNTAAATALGYARDELADMSIRDLHPFEMRAFNEFVDRVLSLGAASEGHLTCRTRDGRFVPANINARCLSLQGRSCVLAVAHFSESESLVDDPRHPQRYLTDPELQRELAQTRFLLHHAPDNILWIASNGRILYANQTIATALGRACEEIEHGFIWDLDAHLDEATFLRQVETFRQRRRMQFDRRMLRNDGSTFPVSVTMQLLHDGEREIIVSFSRDITEESQARDEARRYLSELARVSRQTAISEMAASIAHEIDQPLTAMLTWVRSCLRLLDRPELCPDLLRRGLDGTLASAERIESIIGRLRHYMKTGEPQTQDMAADALISGCRDLIEAQARYAGVVFEEDIENNLPWLRVDALLVQQVVLNLTRNAIEAMQDVPRARRQMRLSVQCGGTGEVCFRVSDSGPGIESGLHDHLFEPFFTTKGQGLGIGLSLCRSILQSHGGDIALASTAELGGTTFEFILPGLGEDAQRA